MRKFYKKDLTKSISDYINNNQIVKVDQCDFIDDWSKDQIKELEFNRYLYYTLNGFTQKHILIPKEGPLRDSFLKALGYYKEAFQYKKEYDYSGDLFDKEKIAANLRAAYINQGLCLITCFIQGILIEPLLNGQLYRDLPYPSVVVNGWDVVEDYEERLISIKGKTSEGQWGYEAIYIFDFWLNDVPRQLKQEFDDLVEMKFRS
jgi:hypothetical protein